MERAGIRAHRGAQEAVARRLNEAYLCWLTRGRPLVTAFYALGLDGASHRLEAADLSETARRELSRLRGTADRTVSSVEALLAEDPALTGLAANGVTALHVEAAPAALDELIRRGLLDKVVVFVTPTLGGSQTTAASHQGPGTAGPATCARALRDLTFERFGEVALVTGYLTDSDRPPDGAPSGGS
jgi:riboflavin biosynthesis pyrimidine reductase